MYGTKKKDEFTEDTILGSDINRIRHLFYYLKSEELELTVTYQSEHYTATVTQVGSSTAALSIPAFEEGALRRCRLKFGIWNELYQFEVPIIIMGTETITIKIPAFIQSAQRRKYPRIQVDDMFMKFITIYQPLFGKQTAGQVMDTRYPQIIRELVKDEPNLYLVNRIITEEVNRITPYFNFKFYGEQTPDSFLETQLRNVKRTIYIRDTTNRECYYEPFTLYGLVNFQREYYSLLRSKSEEEARAFFEEIRQQDSRNYLHNYVITPIKVFNSIVGHIYAYSPVLDNIVISPEQASRVDMLAQMLSYAMSKTLITRTYYQHSLTRVVNISLAGLLFELNDEVLFDYLTFHDRIRMTLQIHHHSLHLTGEVARYYPVDDGFHIGIRFLHAEPGDFLHLEKYIFERSRITFQ